MVKDMTEYIEKQNKKHLKKFRTVQDKENELEM